MPHDLQRQPQTRGRFAEIDLLRGYAVAMVVFLHLNLSNPFPNVYIAGIVSGTAMEMGVDLFFVISGFVIARALAALWDVKTADDARQFRNVPLTFYRKRFIRLWPAAAIWLVLNVVLAGLFTWQVYWPPIGAVAAKALFGFVYLYNVQEYQAPEALGYFWSLSVEWQFYLLFPVFLLLVRGHYWRIGFLLAALALSVWLRPGGAGWAFFRFDGLVLGILLYMLLDRLDIAIPTYGVFQSRYGFLVTLILLATMMVIPAYTPDVRIGYLLATGIATVLVALAAADRGYISTFGIGPVIAWLGSRSYSIYLVHMPIILSVLALRHLALTGFARPYRLPFEIDWFYGVSIVLTVVIAEVTFRAVERPSHRRSRAIGYDTVAPART